MAQNFLTGINIVGDALSISGTSAISSSRHFAATSITNTGNLIGTTADFYAAGNGNDPIFHVKDTADTFVALFEGNRAGDTGANIHLRHWPTTAAETNRTHLFFEMKDDGNNVTKYGTIGCFIDDYTGGTEDGNLRFSVMKNSTSTEMMRINATGVGIGETSPTNLLEVKSTTAWGATLQLNQASDGAEGAQLFLKHTSASPADDDYLAFLHFKGMNSAAQEVQYARIHATSADVTDGTEDGSLFLMTAQAGTENSNGIAIVGGKVGIGLTNPASKLHIRTSTNFNYEFEEVSSKLRLSALNDARSANVPLEFAASSFGFLTGNATFGGAIIQSMGNPYTKMIDTSSGGDDYGLNNNASKFSIYNWTDGREELYFGGDGNAVFTGALTVGGTYTSTGDRGNSGFIQTFRNTNTGGAAYVEALFGQSGSSELRIGHAPAYGSADWNASWVYAVGKPLFLKSSSGNVVIYAGGGGSSAIAATFDTSQNATFAGDILWSSDAGGDIGASSGSRPDDIYCAGGIAVNTAIGAAGTLKTYSDIISGAKITLPDNQYLNWSGSNTRMIGNSDYLQLQVAGADKVRLKSDGNVGIATTTIPTTYSASGGGWKVLQIGQSSQLAAYGTDDEIALCQNTYLNASGAFQAITSNVMGSSIILVDGKINFKNATSSGTTQTTKVRMYIHTDGKVGIGENLTAPLAILDVKTSGNTAIPALNAVPGASTSAIFRNSGNTVILATGVSNTNVSWLQGRQTTGTGSAFNIALNPLGGNVGVGTVVPIQKLDTPNIVIGGTTIASTYRANALFIDNNAGVSRFYSAGADGSTKGSYQFNIMASDANPLSTPLTLNADDSATFAGTVTASAFVGDGSNLTGLTSTVHVNNTAANQTHYIVNTRGTSGQQTPYVDAGLVYNPATNLLTIQGTTRIQANGTFYSDRTYLGDTYTFGSGETGDGVTFKIAGAASNTTGNYFKFQTQAGGATPATALTINKDLSSTFAGDVTVHKDAPKVTLKDTGTGNAMTSEFQFQDGNGVARGYLGYGSSGNSVMYLQNTLSELHLHTSSGLCQTLSGTSTAFAGDIIASGGAVHILANQITSGWNADSEDSDIWINYRGYAGGTTRFRDFRVGDGKQNQIALFDGSNSNVAIGVATTFNEKLTVASANGTAYTSVPQIRVSSTTNSNRAAILFTDSALSDGKISYYPHGTAASRFFSISARLTESDFIVKGDGNVGIGETSPVYRLDVNSGSDSLAGAYIQAGKSSQGELQNTGLIVGTRTDIATDDYVGISFTGNASTPARGRAGIGAKSMNGPSGMDLVFMTRNAADGTQLGTADVKMTIESSGDVGIGTATPGSILHVAGASPEVRIAATTDGQTARLGLYEDTAGFNHGGYIQYVGGGDTLRLGLVNGNVDVDVLTMTDGGAAIFGGDVYKATTRSWQLSGAVGNTTYPTYGFYGDTGIGMYHAGTDTLAFATAANTRMTINPTGNVGIGVTPGAVVAGNIRLDVGTIGCGITSRQNYETIITANADYGTATTTGRNASRLYLQNNGDINFATAPAVNAGSALTFTERIHIMNAGNVGIGDSAPAVKLHVQGAGGAVSPSSYSVIDLAIENSGEAALGIIGTTYSSIYFGDAASATIGGIVYNHSTNAFYSGKPWVFQNTLTCQNVLQVTAGAGNSVAGLSWTSTDSGYLFAKTGNATKVIINSAGASYFNGGNVGIGTATPAQRLEVEGDIRIKTARSLFLGRHGDEYAWRIRNESAADSSTYGFDGTNDLIFEVVSNSSLDATPSATSHNIYGSSVNTLVLRETGRIGMGTAIPGARLHVQQDTAGEEGVNFMNNSTGSGAAMRLEINVGSPAGHDPMLSFNVGNGGLDWTVGVDNSDGDKFKISGGTDSHNTNPGTNDRLTIDASGATFAGSITLNGSIVGATTANAAAFTITGSAGKLAFANDAANYYAYQKDTTDGILLNGYYGVTLGFRGTGYLRVGEGPSVGSGSYGVTCTGAHFEAKGVSSYRWTGINASGATDRKHTIMRVYFTPNHWSGEAPDIKITLQNEYYSVGHQVYRLQGWYGMGNGSSFKLWLDDIHAGANLAGISSNSISLGSVVDAGWDHSGQNVYYQDVYANVDGYSQTSIIAEFNGHTYQTTNPTSGGYGTVVNRVPTVVDATFTSDTKKIYEYFGREIIATNGQYALTLKSHGSSATIVQAFKASNDNICSVIETTDSGYLTSFKAQNGGDVQLANDDLTGKLKVDDNGWTYLTAPTNSGLEINSPGGAYLNTMTSNSTSGNWKFTTNVSGVYEFNKGATFTGNITTGSTISLTSDGSTSHTNSRIILNSTQSNARGAGVFMHNTNDDQEWYVGVPYAQGFDKFMIAHKSTAAHADSTAELANSKIYIDTSGNVTLAGTISNTGTGTATFGGPVGIAGMITVTQTDIGTGESVGLRILNSGASQQWNITSGITGVDNATFNIRNSTGNINALSINTSGNATFAGTVQVPKLGVVSVNNSYDLYNNGTTYLNGTTILNGDATVNSGLYPDANDGAQLGNASLTFSDAHIGHITIDDYIYHKTDPNTYLYMESDSIKLRTGGVDRLRVNTAYNTSYVADGLHGASALPSYIASVTGRRLVMGYQDNGSGLYAAAYAFETDSTDGANNTNIEKDCLIVYNYDAGTPRVFRVSNLGKVTAASDVIAYSDKKLKKNIKTLDGSKVYDMRGVSFNRTDLSDKEGSGVIAQEIQKVAPELISVAEDGTLGVAYGNITGYLIEAIKDLKAEVEELKNHKCDGCTK